jgi:cation transport ATPase
MGDIVLFEPGEAIPCDGTLWSQWNVSGAMGESDMIK